MMANETLIFVAVINASSISKAAKQLGMTPGAISQALDRLEKSLDVKLIHRTKSKTKSIELTEFGIPYYQKVEAIACTLEDANNDVLHMHENPRGRIKLAAPLAFSSIILAKILPEFLELYPDIDIELKPHPYRDYPEPGMFDLIIMAGPLQDSARFRSKPLVTWNHVICASPSYLKKFGTPSIPSDLEKDHIILDYNYRLTGRIWHLYKDLRKNKKVHTTEYKVKHSTNIDTANAGFILSCAKNGGGIILVPIFTVKDDIENGNLVPLLTDYYSKQIAVSMVHSFKPKSMPKKVKLLMDFIFKRVKELDYNTINTVNLVSNPALDDRILK